MTARVPQIVELPELSDVTSRGNPRAAARTPRGRCAYPPELLVSCRLPEKPQHATRPELYRPHAYWYPVSTCSSCPHAPLKHPVSHALPQEPQLLASARMFTHVPPQSRKPAGQLFAQPPAMHTWRSPAGVKPHARPQVPQLAPSTSRFAQRAPQAV